MKWLMFITYGFLLGAITAGAALAETDPYLQSEQYQAAKHANDFLRTIREDVIHDDQDDK